MCKDRVLMWRVQCDNAADCVCAILVHLCDSASDDASHGVAQEDQLCVAVVLGQDLLHADIGEACLRHQRLTVESAELLVKIDGIEHELCQDLPVLALEALGLPCGLRGDGPDLLVAACVSRDEEDRLDLELALCLDVPHAPLGVGVEVVLCELWSQGCGVHGERDLCVVWVHVRHLAVVAHSGIGKHISKPIVE